MLKAVLKAESLIALGLMALAAYFMLHASRLPIGWDAARGPGGGAFPFWLSLVIFGVAAAILVRSVLSEAGLSETGLSETGISEAGHSEAGEEPFFDREMLPSVLAVTAALGVTIALMPVAGTYIAVPLFMVWYLRFFGGNGWRLTAILALATPVVLFFFFEVALRILLPKGMTEPLFFPLYAMFF